MTRAQQQKLIQEMKKEVSNIMNIAEKARAYEKKGLPKQWDIIIQAQEAVRMAVTHLEDICPPWDD